jgi:predicted lipoprotein with Yx(FWY)xxD motif
MRKTSILTTVLAVGVVVLSGCGGGDDDTAAGSAAETAGAGPTETTESAPAEDAVLAVGDSDLGQIVVDGDGMTVYIFDRDTQNSGTSACTGGCLEAWPPVLTESEEPTVEGVTGEVGTITRDDGTMQVTLDGWPLYLWQDDANPGDTTGQGVQGVWWVVDADGAKITAAPSPAAIQGY